MPVPDIEALKSALVTDNTLAGRCTIAVFVGLLAEYIILFWTKRKEFSRKEFGLAIAAAILIAGGVYGEYFFGSRASEAALGIERKSEETMAALNKEAGDARLDAANANKDAGETEERSVKLEVQAATLRKQVEDERMARIRLAESIAWRTPDRALIPKLALPLQRFAGQQYAIVFDLGDPERYSLSTWIIELLSTGKWQVGTTPSLSETTFEATNIVLWLSPTAPDRVFEAAQALVSEMEHGGLPTVVLKSAWGPQADRAAPELIRVVIFRRGPRMHITELPKGPGTGPANLITFDGTVLQFIMGSGPPK